MGLGFTFKLSRMNNFTLDALLYTRSRDRRNYLTLDKDWQVTEMQLTSQSTKTLSSEKNVCGMKYLVAGDSDHYSAAILMICMHQTGMGFHTQIFEYVGPCLE